MLYCFNCVQLLQPHGLQAASLLYPWDSSGKNTEVGCCALLQALIFISSSASSTSSKHSRTYLSLKWVLKQQTQLATPTHLVQELLTNVQCRGASRSFAKETRALKMRGWSMQVDSDQLRGSLKVIPLQLHEKLPKNCVSHSLVFWHLKLIGKVKKLISGCSWADHK